MSDDFLKDLLEAEKSGEIDKELLDSIESEKTTYKVDERILELNVPKDKTSRVIRGRFLPKRQGSRNNYIKRYKHVFKGANKKWIDEICPTTFKKDCPICDKNKKMWDAGSDAQIEVKNHRKRDLKYYANFYVEKDDINPENNGKVFILRFPKTIFEKIEKALKPEFEDEKPVNAFKLLDDGANFVFRMTKEKKPIGGKMVEVPNYEKCTFETPSAFMDGDIDEIRKVMESCHNLESLLEGCKSYEELSEKLDSVDSIKIAGESIPKMSNRQGVDDLFENDEDKEEDVDIDDIVNSNNEEDELPF